MTVETQILTPEASSFLTKLARGFEPRRQEFWRAAAFASSRSMPASCPISSPKQRTSAKSEWTVAPIPHDLLDRRVEITGPVDRKMIINALNSGANVFMADFEDSNSPTWQNNLEGQVNLRDAVEGTISYVSPEGKRYELNPTRGNAGGASARLASGGETFSGGWQANLRISVRFRTLLLSQRASDSSVEEPDHISICPRWRAISKRVCGTMSSVSRRMNSASPAAPSAPPF